MLSPACPDNLILVHRGHVGAGRRGGVFPIPFGTFPHFSFMFCCSGTSCLLSIIVVCQRQQAGATTKRAMTMIDRYVGPGDIVPVPVLITFYIIFVLFTFCFWYSGTWNILSFRSFIYNIFSISFVHIMYIYISFIYLYHIFAHSFDKTYCYYIKYLLLSPYIRLYVTVTSDLQR